MTSDRRSMRLAAAGLLAAGLVATAAPARAADLADPEVGYKVNVPDGLPYQSELTVTILQGFSQEKHLRNATFRANGKAYADAESGVAVYVLWLTTQDKVADPVGAIHEELDAKGKRPELLGKPAAIEVAMWKADVGDTLATAELDFHDRDDATRSHARTIIFADGAGKLHEIDVECVNRDDSPEAMRKACDQAVMSLAVTTGASNRVAFAAAAAPAPATDATSGAQPATGAAIGPAAPGNKPLLVTEPQPAHGSRRWMFYAGGALLVAAILLAARKRRAPARDDEEPKS